ncbi:unnamed protein product [Meganyctiphanes norvegica]|uniref:NTF2-related export protein n=1 Tax=Meganyctiphanes norvegica TaxID=48144 RepID=A0AAV2RC28_MEGNR
MICRIVNKTHEMAADAERLKATLAIESATSFVKIYYDFVDKMRHKLAKLYMEEASLVWNGNTLKGNAAIQKFYEDLPVSSHTITCMDSQPVRDENAGGQSTILVTTYGTSSFQERKQLFQQTFLITAENDKWKVVSDNFRFQTVVA